MGWTVFVFGSGFVTGCLVAGLIVLELAWRVNRREKE